MDWKWMGCKFNVDFYFEIEGNVDVDVDCFSILPPQELRQPRLDDDRLRLPS